MLNIQNLSFGYGGRVIFQEASLHVKPKNRIGLIGLNGRGKTTLLKLIHGDLTPDSGEISMSKETTLGFLNQDLLSYQSEESILDVALQAFQEQLDLQHQIDKVLKEMETNYTDDLVDKLAKMQERFEALDGYTIRAKAEEILEGLGFSTADLAKPLHQFSGGWRMRVMLAKLLLQKPSVLMLDEPTNHLDLPSIEWLENYLSSYEGAIMIVSHDQEFLERAVNITVEVTGGKLVQYSGNYSFYLQEKELRNEIQRNAFKNQQQQIKQTENFINRFRAKATKSRQVQSKVKMLEKMDLVEEVQEEVVDLNIRFTFKQQPGKIIVGFEDANKAYGKNVIFKDTTISIERGDKIALIGANGKGKSTLLRMVANSEQFEGRYLPGYNVIPAFYAQHQLESLDVQSEILDELKQAGSEKTESELRNILGCFLFQGDDVFKKIKVLSGGEKSRVALAKTLISEANFLLLDEPTNHLDMQSVNILIQALQAYEGTYLAVSHNRYFISQIANKIWYIEDQMVKEYPGTYDEYVFWMSEREAQAQQTDNSSSQKSAKKAKKKVYSDAERTKLQKQIKQLKKQVEVSEMEIDQLESEKKNHEAALASPEVFNDPKKLQEVNQAYEQVKQKLLEANETWELAVLELEEVEGELS